MLITHNNRLQILERPVTSILITLCTSVWAWLNHKHLGYQEVGLSHELIVQNKQFWRIVSSQLSHVDFVHLLFNMTSLWSLGGYEQGGKNSWLVLQQSLWLLVGAGLVRLAGSVLVGCNRPLKQSIHGRLMHGAKKADACCADLSGYLSWVDPYLSQGTV